jgi:enoyl-CoA hydratase
MTTEKVRYKVQDGIAYVTINNPQKMNILDFDAYNGLILSFESIEEDDQVRVAILTAEGDKAFICGQDISTFNIKTVRDGKRLLRLATKLFTRLESMNKPVIAAVNGLALGGGTEIILACDMVVASEKARFGLPESGIGVVPVWGAIRLANAVGRSKAKELMMTGDIISAKEAMEIGLVNKVVPQENLLGAAEEIARKVMTKAPLAIELIKAMGNRDILCEGLPFTFNANLLFFQTEDLKEGIDAFFKKRKPVFRGV